MTETSAAALRRPAWPGSPRCSTTRSRTLPRARGSSRRSSSTRIPSRWCGARARRASGRRRTAPIALVTGGKGTPDRRHDRPVGVGDQPHRGGWAFRTTARRAIEVGFRGDIAAPEGEAPVRAGLVMPLPARGRGAEPARVLTRDGARRFSEEDVDGLAALVDKARPPISRALNLRDPDVVPGARHAHRPPRPPVVPRRARAGALRARLAHYPLALLVIDVDRLTCAERADRDRRRGRRPARAGEPPPSVDAPPRLRVPARRRPLRDRPPGCGARDASELFEAIRDELAANPIGDAGAVSVSGGDRGARGARRRGLVVAPRRGGAHRGRARSPRIGALVSGSAEGAPEGATARSIELDPGGDRPRRPMLPGRRVRYSEA